MTYKQTLDWMFGRLPMYQRQGKTAFKKDLTNIRAFSAVLKNPETNFKSVHVAGTNGKGSVCHMLASVFQEAGYKTGLYTSPHLKDFRERIRINGRKIPSEYVIDFIAANKAFLEKHGLSFFEMTVGMAFQYFADEKVDMAIIETGLGGRLDSTNILLPELSIITNIGLDHTKFLGDTLAKIAFEKAGIIKPSIPVLIGETQPETSPVFMQKAEECKSPLYFAENFDCPDYDSDLKGVYQGRNKRTLSAATQLLKKSGWEIGEEQIVRGLKNVKKNTGLRGRWEQLGERPKIVCDTGHNKEGLELVMAQLAKENFKKLHIVMGVVNDKDLSRILPLFPKDAAYYFCKPDVPRGLSAQDLQKTATNYALNGKAYDNVKMALESAKSNADPDDLIFIGGSTFTVAEVL